MNRMYGIVLASLLLLGLGLTQAQAGKLPNGYPESFDEYGNLDFIDSYDKDTYKIVVSDLSHYAPRNIKVHFSASSTGSIGRLRVGQNVGLILDAISGDVAQIWVLPKKYKP